MHFNQINIAYVNLLLDDFAGLGETQNENPDLEVMADDPGYESAIRRLVRSFVIPRLNSWPVERQVEARKALAYLILRIPEQAPDRFLSEHYPFGAPSKVVEFYEFVWNELFEGADLLSENLPNDPVVVVVDYDAARLDDS